MFVLFTFVHLPSGLSFMNKEFLHITMADIIDNEEIDKDTVSPEILEQQFTKKYKLLTEKAVSLKKSYINKLSATNSLRIAVSQSDSSIEIYQLTDSGLSRTCHLSGHPKGLTMLVVSPEEENQLYSCGSDGSVKLWDTRAGGSCMLEYQDEEPRPLECLDVSCTGRVLCAGSALMQDDAFLVFWDTRAVNPLGGYWNTHSDDVTQVRFHPSEPSALASGAADGVINIYDISHPSEDDALTYSIPVASGVERLSWVGGAGELLGVATGCHQVALCNAATGSVLKTYSREQLAKGIRRSKSEDCYVVDIFSGAQGVPEVLAGSYGEDGSMPLRSASLSPTVGPSRVQPRALLPDNRQTRDIVVGGGEEGLISLWAGDADGDGASAAVHIQTAATMTSDSLTITNSTNRARATRYQPY